MMYEQARTLAGQLRLNGFYHALEKRCNDAVAKGLHPGELLRLLLEDEQLARQNAFAKRLTARARFRSPCDLDTWDMSQSRGYQRPNFANWRRARFTSAKRI
jgi:hypothetical protein